MYGENSCRFTAREFNQADLKNLVAVLEAIGITIDCEISPSGKTATLEFKDLPSVWDAKIKRTRNAGPRSQGIRVPQDSIFTNDTRCSEFLEWQENHTAAEGMKQLGISSRATYYRRLKVIRENVEWEHVNNPQRIKRGMKELHHTLGNVQ